MSEEVLDLCEKDPNVILAIMSVHGFEKVMNEIKEIRSEIAELRKEMTRPGWRSMPERRHKP